MYRRICIKTIADGKYYVHQLPENASFYQVWQKLRLSYFEIMH